MKNLISIITISILCQIANSQTPYWEWAQSGGSTQYDRAVSIAYNDEGNLIVAGYFQSTAYFETETLTTTTSFGMFIAEYNTDGDMLWIKHVANADGGLNPEYVFVDDAGDIYVAGTFGGYSYADGITFLPSTSLAPSVGGGFVSKFSDSGDLIWANVILSADGIDFVATMDESDNLIISGTMWSAIDFYDGTSTYTLSGDLLWHIYAAKYSSEGAIMTYAKILNSPQVLYARDIVTDDGLYMTGIFNGQLICGIIPDTFWLYTDVMYSQVFMARFDPVTFSIVWATITSGPTYSFANTLTVDNDDHLFVTGTYYNEMSFGMLADTQTIMSSAPYGENFIAQYDTAGEIILAKNAGHSAVYRG